MIVVGAGIVGAACAWQLSRTGRRVLVVESAPAAGGGATAAGMGHIIVTDDSEAQFALCHWSQLLWDELSDSLPAGIQREQCGALWVALDDEEAALVAEKAAFYEAHGVAVETLDQAQVRLVEPELSHAVVAALRVPGDSVVYPPVAVDWLLGEVESAGGEVRYGQNVDRARSGGIVLEDGSRLDADIVVNAAGDRAMRLLDDPSLRGQVRGRKGHLAITERARCLTRHQVAELGYFRSAHGPEASSVAFNVQPRPTEQMLIGSSRQFGSDDSAIEPPVLARMLRRAQELLPAIASLRVIRTWTGFRAATPDKLPFIGPVPGQDGLFVASGHEGLGITTSLGSAAIIAALVEGLEPAIDASPYRLDRELSSWGAA